ncbi:RNA polymerase sigma-70 factor (family 1) [Catalinimonas alkaloidigena]|uniref:RNA polymerase sigma-70 factor n=1 Tax=Catalinimonas alkaloidigena TaxID=1075417 RepID=UPI002406D641|nr:RNA polymerase sigma-70 factor [Catalinimonas alkaloidigena]MDF9796417.1 RNA polymerase sigma-70 factor (family 1) [Catalinimonas alkaloidigena]
MNIIDNKRLLFDNIAEGDKKAFDTFFAFYYQKLIQFALIFLNTEQEAEDVVAEVLTNMLAQRERVFKLNHFEAYLYASVKNKCLSFIRKQGKVNQYNQGFEQSIPFTTNTSDPYEKLVEEELSTLIQQVIINLPPRRKMVFQLIREENFSYRKVAELMDISERTVEVHLKLAIETLRTHIEKYGATEKSKK